MEDRQEDGSERNRKDGVSQALLYVASEFFSDLDAYSRLFATINFYLGQQTASTRWIGQQVDGQGRMDMTEH